MSDPCEGATVGATVDDFLLGDTPYTGIDDNNPGMSEAEEHVSTHACVSGVVINMGHSNLHSINFKTFPCDHLQYCPNNY